MSVKIDRAKLVELYLPGTEGFTLVDVPEMPFAMIDGEGSPDHGASAKAIKTLFMAIYPIRREARKRMGKNFVEAPLEMLYWADDMHDLAAGNKENWKWKVMVVLPDWVDDEMFAQAVAEARGQVDEVPESLRLEKFAEGRCAQIMHFGRQQEVPATLERLYTEFLPQNKLDPAGPYHEIYLNDWSRVPPEKRKIVLRQPVRAAD